MTEGVEFGVQPDSPVPGLSENAAESCLEARWEKQKAVEGSAGILSLTKSRRTLRLGFSFPCE
jgi:hypothetical protein